MDNYIKIEYKHSFMLLSRHLGPGRSLGQIYIYSAFPKLIIYTTFWFETVTIYYF